MACYYPIHAFRSLTPGEGVHFKRTSHSGEAITLPCGQCIGCRIDKANSWAIRLMHERHMHEDSMFLTLTYSPEHLPENGTLVPKHFQDFMKRYRFAIAPTKIRFFHAGEYGERTQRPHYHAIIFGHQFSDMKVYKKTPLGHKIYTSETLDKLWGHGENNTIGNVSLQSCNYTARYVMKKINGDRAKEHYRRVDPDTGEIIYLQPEYATMSRRPGIGRTWLDQYSGDVFPHDSVVLPDGKEGKTPRYYLDVLKQKDLKLHNKIKRKRASRAKTQKRIGETAEHRLVAKETVKKASLSMLKRNLENES